MPPGTGATVARTMFVFFSNRLGCLGSILVSLVLSAVLFALLRGCQGGGGSITL